MRLFSQLGDAVLVLFFRFRSQLRRTVEGQGLVEYMLLLALIALVVIGAISLVGTTISEVWYEKIIEGWPD